MLAVSGGFDMRTPTDGAAAVVSRFPHGQLVVVPGVGHDPVDADFSLCALQAVRLWMTGGTPASQCARPAPLLRPIPAFPAPTVRKTPFSAQATYSIAAKTLAEAEASWLGSSSRVVPGLYGGKLSAAQREFTLTRYSIAPGVTLSGKVRLRSTTPPFGFQGTLTVGGRSAADGILGLNGSTLRGTLGGRIVGR
jgi:hypothetical protein